MMNFSAGIHAIARINGSKRIINNEEHLNIDSFSLDVLTSKTNLSVEDSISRELGADDYSGIFH